MLNRGLLMVGTHLILGMAPHVVHRVQFRAALRQPEQTDPQLPRQPNRAVGCVTGVLIQ